MRVRGGTCLRCGFSKDDGGGLGRVTSNASRLESTSESECGSNPRITRDLRLPLMVLVDSHARTQPLSEVTPVRSSSESETEPSSGLWASASWVITTRAGFWVCRCR